jgi:hypothetical protein
MGAIGRQGHFHLCQSGGFYDDLATDPLRVGCRHLVDLDPQMIARPDHRGWPDLQAIPAKP